jgi:DNA polymerase
MRKRGCCGVSLPSQQRAGLTSAAAQGSRRVGKISANAICHPQELFPAPVVDAEGTKPGKGNHVAEIRTLKALAAAEAGCTRCPLYRRATQAVPGEGAARARIMLVGEQPGDREDIEGHPFVGPAGRILDRALEEAGLPRGRLFVTNAVKHFKFEPRGKRRLHKRPNAYEVDRCRVWLDLERAIVKPEIVIALGVTALRGLTGKTVTIARLRGRRHPLGDGVELVATVHPSYLLRIRDEADKREQYRRFVRDLRLAA